MSIKVAAEHFGVSQRWVKELLRRYAHEWEMAFESRFKRPKTSRNRTEPHVRDRIALRESLTQQGFGAGAETIQLHLENEGHPPPARPTIHRILREGNKVINQPQKRPKSSLIRFEAAMPNEMWQADFTHWTLADGQDTEILDFIDDHSRYLISIRAYKRVTGKIVADQFTAAAIEHGRPYCTLTDNGLVFTTRFVARKGLEKPGPNRFEKLLKDWDIKQINGSPRHPKPKGKSNGSTAP